MVEAYKLPEHNYESRLEKVNQIQSDACKTVIEGTGSGSLSIATGVGKTFTAFKYISSLMARRLIAKDSEIWFLAETTTRYATLIEEADKFEETYGTNPIKEWNINFHCYQGQPRGNPHVIIADEIHDSLTPKYKAVYENGHKYLLGLSATIPVHSQLYKDDEDDNTTKGDILREIGAPIVFNYPLQSAIEDGILSPFNTRIVKHSLDQIAKVVPSGTKKKPFMGTESSAYGFLRGVVMSPWAQSGYKGLCAKRMCRMLWQLQSKAKVTKALVNSLEGKTIIFGVELALLELITDNVVKGGDKAQEVKNAKLIADFNSGKINVIASAKKLKQGITLKGVTNCIIVSYYKQSHSMLQQLGRIVRFVEDKLANLYIFETAGTYEVSWLDNINKVYDEDGKVSHEVDLNISEYLLSENILLYGTKSRANSKT